MDKVLGEQLRRVDSRKWNKHRVRRNHGRFNNKVAEYEGPMDVLASDCEMKIDYDIPMND